MRRRTPQSWRAAAPTMPLPDGRAAVARGAAELGLGLDAAALDRLSRFAHLLGRWGAVYNLTALRGEQQVRALHLLDSLAIVPPLDRWSGGRRLRVLDVGSGGGLPGAVIAIARPGWTVTCVDAVAKKVAFVTQVSAELGLANLRAIHGRVETVAPLNADIVVSRAFGALGEFVGVSMRHLAIGGVWVAMKGQRPDDEIASLPAGVEVFHVEPLAVPELDAQRHLVWLRRSASAFSAAPDRA